jgi:hypothetical protein
MSSARLASSTFRLFVKHYSSYSSVDLSRHSRCRDAARD